MSKSAFSTDLSKILRLGSSFVLPLVCALTYRNALAQNPQPANAPAAASAAQKVTPLTTTVVVQGQVSDDYLPTDLTVGSLDGLPLLSAPVSATVVTRDLMNDQVSRVLSDVIKNDASIGEDYAPVGYYGDYEIRGFTVDLATGIEINGMPIAGEQDVPFENKQRVEFLKGIAGVEGGVTTAGGLIDYVTKRPALVTAIDVATDHRGTSYAALDIGRLFGKAKQFGLRGNMAGEAIHTYVESANGWRGVGTAAGDWKLSDNVAWKADFEYQHKRERSVAGYQLLGGTTVPALNTVFPSVMLADQPWSKPNIFDAFNANSRIDVHVTPAWHAYLEGSYSHSLIDDNVIYPYGAALAADGVTSLCPNSPIYFYCPDGSYEAYDYRSPGELRIDAIGEAIAMGQIRTGHVTQDIVFGGSMFDRGVDLSPDIIYNPIGVENIFQPNVVFAEQTYTPPSPSVQADFNHQTSAIVQDRITLPGRVRLTAGGRYVSTSDYSFNGESKSLWLPQYSATYAPSTSVTVYGSYGVTLSLGPEAPFWTLNVPNSGYLRPFLTRQAEVGVKYEPGQRILLTTSLFRMRAPFFYPKLINAPDATCTQPQGPGLCFEADGHETHDGVELSAQGKAANWLSLSATAAGIQATSDDSSTPAYNGKQVINQPRFRTAFFADLTLPRTGPLHLSDFHLMPGWGYTSRKEATRDDITAVGGYNLFSLGARYSPGGESSHLTLRMYADNILDKRYWKDTGASYGDTFIHLGAPTTVRLSGQYRF
jgi:iron complex outermembrane receptor protein